jgi:hypothetical protein
MGCEWGEAEEKGRVIDELIVFFTSYDKLLHVHELSRSV